MNKGSGRRLAQVRRRLGSQVFELLGRGGATQYLVAVRVAPKAPYDATGGLGLRDPELVQHLEVQRCVGRFLLGVADATLVESEVLGVAQRQPEEVPLLARGPSHPVRRRGASLGRYVERTGPRR